ncbi:transglutaminase [Mesonia sp. K7]|nr:transglutaminase [Mesonia sp. K7]
MHINKLPFLLFFIASLSTQAQYSQEYKNYKNKYPNAHSVRLQNHVKLNLEVKRGDIEITREVIEEDLYLDESANYNSKKSLKFSSFFELGKIKASSFSFNEDKYEEFKVSDFTQKDHLDGSFHDDTKILSYIYPNLKKGSKSKLEYTEKIKNPRFITPFYFSDFFPIVDQKFVVETDKEIDIRFVKVNMDDFNVKYTTEQKRGKNIHTWEIKNVEKVKSESNTPSYSKIFPHIIPIINSYQGNDDKINILRNTQDLYNWYYDLTKNLNEEEPSEALIKTTKELIKDKTSEFEKVKTIYYWVQQNIKYIDFEYELGGFIPREANAVYEKKYGDCKDNSSILKEMFEIANIKGYLTWIGTRDLSYTYNNVPTPLSDNHMILTYKTSEGKNYYLDATGRYLSIEYPSSFIQGKEALIGNGKNGFDIQMVPYVEAKKNKYIDSTYIKIENDKLIGQSQTSISGYLKLDLFSDLERNKSEQDLRNVYKAYVEKGNNKFIIEDFEEINKFGYEEPFELKYSFTIQDYVKTIGDEIYLNPNLNKDLIHLKFDPDRVHSYEQDYKKYFRYVNTFDIPEGYKVTYMPESLSIKNDLLSINISYEIKNNQLIANQEFTLDFIEINTQEQKELNSFIKQISKQYNETIVLKKQ